MSERVEDDQKSRPSPEEICLGIFGDPKVDQYVYEKDGQPLHVFVEQSTWLLRLVRAIESRDDALIKDFLDKLNKIEELYKEFKLSVPDETVEPMSVLKKLTEIIVNDEFQFPFENFLKACGNPRVLKAVVRWIAKSLAEVSNEVKPITFGRTVLKGDGKNREEIRIVSDLAGIRNPKG